MAITTISDLGEKFLSLNQDYKLITLYNTSGSDTFNDYIEPWVYMALDELNDAKVTGACLVYSGSAQAFTTELSQKDQNLIAQIMIKFWLHKELMDVLQMRNFLQDSDFKHHSNANALKAKQDAYNAKREEINQILTNYGYRDIGWTNWEDQKFS